MPGIRLGERQGLPEDFGASAGSRCVLGQVTAKQAAARAAVIETEEMLRDVVEAPTRRDMVFDVGQQGLDDVGTCGGGLVSPNRR